MALQNIVRISALTGSQIAKPVVLRQPIRLTSTKGGCYIPKSKTKAPKKIKPARDCTMYKVPICSEEVLKAKSKTKPCEEKVKPADVPPECCPNPCIDMLPRFDDLYYAPSDKNRKYQITWCEFGELQTLNWPICCYQEFDVPKPERRKIVRKNIAQSEMCEMARQCPNNVHPQCAKIVWPGCRTKRCEFKCRIFREKDDCKKPCTPYPSFSECKKLPPRPMRPIECDCLKVKDFCIKEVTK
ncbi:uncharacterized protein [Eurosta solidaginis]|uniref:uncharacterized protein n=1 Tax=Eurosta solidaginis TaxID=178769 RepID=UPI00353177C0